MNRLLNGMKRQQKAARQLVLTGFAVAALTVPALAQVGGVAGGIGGGAAGSAGAGVGPGVGPTTAPGVGNTGVGGNTNVAPRGAVQDGVNGARNTVNDATDGVRNTVNGARNSVNDATSGVRNSVNDVKNNATGNWVTDRVNSTVGMDRNSAFDVNRRGALGVSVQTNNNGVTVSNVYNGSVAQRAGLRTGDQIISMNGRQIRSQADLVAGLQAGADVNNLSTITVRRAGQTQNFQVDLSGTAHGATQAAPSSRGTLGVQIEELQNGIRITQVNPNSVAQRLGLRQNDRLVSFNGQPIRSSADLSSQLQSISDAGGDAVFTVDRNGQLMEMRPDFSNRSVGGAASDAAGRAGQLNDAGGKVNGTGGVSGATEAAPNR